MHAGTYSEKPAVPYTPGKDGAGIVMIVGDDKSRFKVNQIPCFWVTAVFMQLPF